MSPLRSHRTALLRWAAALIVGCLLTVPRVASASTSFPPLLKAALDKYYPGTPHCVPLCTACHNTTRGGPGDPNAFGRELETRFGLVLTEDATVDVAIKNLSMADPPADADMDGVSDVQELATGDSPSIAGPAGTGQFCPDIAYGCGAHIAQAPSVDRISLVPAGLVMFGLLGLRRRAARKKTTTR